MPSDRKIPVAICKFFAIRPLIPGEDATVYDQLRDGLIEALEPGSIQEWLLVKDLVDTEWELMRQRTMKAAMVKAAMPQCFFKELDEPTGGSFGLLKLQTQQVRALLNEFTPENAEALQKLLADQGLAVEAVAANAFAATVVVQQHTERMATATSKRRNGLAAELDRERQRTEAQASKLKGTKELPHVDTSTATTAPKASKVGS